MVYLDGVEIDYWAGDEAHLKGSISGIVASDDAGVVCSSQGALVCCARGG